MPARIKKYTLSYLLILPSFALLFSFSYYPMLLAIYHSFTKWDFVTSQWIGFGNYIRMFSEDTIRISMRNLILFVVTDLIKIGFPLLAAELCFLLPSDRWRYVYRTGFTLPLLVPGIVGTLIWLTIYDPNTGLLNQVLSLLGLSNWTRPWLADSGIAIWAIIAMGFPFIGGLNFLIFYSAIGNLSKDIIEAARIDGVTGARMFSKIHLPLLLPQIKTVIILTIIGSLQNYVGVLLMTHGGPGIATMVPALAMYTAAFTASQYGYASAIGVVLFAAILILTVINLKVLKTDY